MILHRQYKTEFNSPLAPEFLEVERIKLELHFFFSNTFSYFNALHPFCSLFEHVRAPRSAKIYGRISRSIVDTAQYGINIRVLYVSSIDNHKPMNMTILAFMDKWHGIFQFHNSSFFIIKKMKRHRNYRQQKSKVIQYRWQRVRNMLKILSHEWLCFEWKI